MKNKGEILASLMNNFKDCCFFLHNTKDLNIVEKIENEGFVFESQLPRSTDRVNSDKPVEVSYFLLQRKDYGNYTVIIAIPKATFDLYGALSNNNDVGIEEIMSITEPYYGDNDELIYTLSPKHVLGHFDIKTSEFVRNKLWDPNFSNFREIPASHGHAKTTRK
jgi:hypothetical protein